jgi:hypothetical protein
MMEQRAAEAGASSASDRAATTFDACSKSPGWPTGFL